MELATEVAGVAWRSPLTVAAGVFVPWEEGWLDLSPAAASALGALTVKSVSLDPWSGNPQPWLADVAGGLLNSVGIKNPGVDAFLATDAPRLARFGLPVVASLAGHSTAEFVELARRLTASGHFALLELNLSCPNTAASQRAFSRTPAAAAEVVAAVRRATELPLLAKLSPDAESIVEVARACEAAGVDGLTLVNALQGMGIDVATGLPRTGTRTAGFSGAGLKALALRIVWDVRAAVSLPIVGLGGIASAEDALEFLLAGASAVGVGAAALRRPGVLQEIDAGLRAHLARHGGTIADRIGLSQRLLRGGGGISVAGGFR